MRVYAMVRVCSAHREEFQQAFPDAKIEGSDDARHECDVLNPGGDNCQDAGRWQFGHVLVNPAKAFATLGGLTKSPARAAASRDNGKKGGRPKKEERTAFEETLLNNLQNLNTVKGKPD